eukprot:431814-Amorphochlora_amoeboformis.AAC.1
MLEIGKRGSDDVEERAVAPSEEAIANLGKAGAVTVTRDRCGRTVTSQDWSHTSKMAGKAQTRAEMGALETLYGKLGSPIARKREAAVRSLRFKIKNRLVEVKGGVLSWGIMIFLNTFRSTVIAHVDTLIIGNIMATKHPYTQVFTVYYTL